MKKIKLSRGMVALIDDRDFKEISKYKWFAMRGGTTGSRFYAARTAKPHTTRPKFIRMHRQIMPPPGGLSIDHINGNSLDNRRKNLRFCTGSQNLMNQSGRGTSSRYKGVGLFRGHVWRARIKADKKIFHLGLFKTERLAAKAYDKAAIKLHGKFARLNFKQKGDSK